MGNRWLMVVVLCVAALAGGCDGPAQTQAQPQQKGAAARDLATAYGMPPRIW